MYKINRFVAISTVFNKRQPCLLQSFKIPTYEKGEPVYEITSSDEIPVRKLFTGSLKQRRESFEIHNSNLFKVIKGFFMN